MTVSIIIPARNASRWLPQTLDSALSQSHRDLDILVVDDCSTDGTAEVVARYADTRLRLLQGDGRGASAARNLGLRHAVGQWVMFLDADDVLSERKVELQLAAIVDRPDCVAACAWGHFDQDPRLASPVEQRCWRESDPVQWLCTSLGGGGMLQTACWLVPRAIADAAGPWDERLSLHDDGEYFCRILLRCNQIRFVDDCHVAYRRIPGSLSRRRSQAATESAFLVCTLRHQYLLERGDTGVVRAALATQWAQFLYEFCCADENMFRSAMKSFVSLEATPTAVIGGRLFRYFVWLFHWRAALALRRIGAFLKQFKCIITAS